MLLKLKQNGIIVHRFHHGASAFVGCAGLVQRRNVVRSQL